MVHKLDDDSVIDVVVIGAGFSGLAMAASLRRKGITSFALLEGASEVGGTWRENTYPGCACDVQSHLYSFSFHPNPDWSSTYAGHAEIQAYILDCVRELDLRPHIVFDCLVTSAAYDEARALWTLTSADGRNFVARTFVMGTGPLHVPNTPNIPGLDRFEGTVMHSARWDHSVDLEGQRVASIGTGASAIQYVPRIAPKVAQLHVYQRTPPWIMPRDERAYTDTQRQRFRRSPRARLLHRALLYVHNEARVLPILVPSLSPLVASVIRRSIAKQVPDPDLRRAMTPDYAVGCKRVLLSNEWYPTFQQSHVELVTDGIREVTSAGIVAQDGTERDVDVIVLGTGFVTDPRVFMSRLPVTGVGGVSLLHTWRESPDAYLGICVHGFPNLFVMVGPNTGLGHNSMIYMIESQAHYIAECLAAMRTKGCDAMHVKLKPVQEYNEGVQHKLKGTAWSSGCNSWYTGEDGKNIAMWPGFTFSYRRRTKRVVERDFEWLSVDT